MSEPIIQIKNLIKEFKVGDEIIRVLKDINVDIVPGNFVVLYGPSGSGKSTLLHSLLGLEPPTSGEIRVADAHFEKMNQDDIARFRLDNIGVVYQRPDWIRSISVLENVAFPLAIKKVPRAERNQRAMELLRSFDIEHRAHFSPTELSGGQQQRVEVARALITDPDILVADEPTGNLDTASAKTVLDFFKRINQDRGITVIMVTHNMEYIKYATQTIHMRDGRVLSGGNQFKMDLPELSEDRSDGDNGEEQSVSAKQEKRKKKGMKKSSPRKSPRKKTSARKTKSGKKL